MTDKWFDVIDQHDFVFVHEAIPNVFEGVYLDVCQEFDDGTQDYVSVRLSRPDARALAMKLLEMCND